MDFLSTDEMSAVLKTMVPAEERKEKESEDVTSSSSSSSSSTSTSSSSSSSSEKATEEIKPYHIPKDASDVSYGCLDKNLPGHREEKYYITTAIAYTNGFPHMGHAYEALTCDVIARYFRMFGFDTFFLTGSDEHGQKVAASAAKLGRDPLEHCNVYANAFQALNQRLAVSNNKYIRTTSIGHEDSARLLWKLCADKGDIYLDHYEGWYNEREETFVPDADAEAMNFMDGDYPLKRIKEESYFFRMSKYGDWLTKYIEEHPEFIQPEMYRNNILARLKSDPLRDLSISRTTFKWGIRVPDEFDQRHVMYVWFDALSNYISGLDYLTSPGNPTSRYWPAQCHLIGKDIVWFHSVIWPCMLYSAGIPLPQTVYCHGFVNAEDGRKMSKTYENTVDPHDVLDKFPLDSIRYYSCMATTFGMDMSFSENSLVTMHNSELADILGNLVHRGLNLCMKFCKGVIPDTTHDEAFPLPFDVEELRSGVFEDMKDNKNAIHSALFRAVDAVRATNRYLTAAEPWKMKGEDEARKPAIVRTTLEAIYLFTHFLAPVIPLAAEKIFARLNTPPRCVDKLKTDFYNLSPGTPVELGEILFSKMTESGISASSNEVKGKGMSAEEQKAAKEAKRAKNAKMAAEQQQKKAEKKAAAASSSAKSTESEDQHDFTKIELRVGQITKVWHHETADKLYCEEIDIGEDSPRQIASGLRDHYSLEEMQNRRLIVVCNLKKASLMGFSSSGMVLCAKSEDGKVEFVTPPEGAAVGERIQLEGVPDKEPYSASQVKKYKVWEKLIAPHLKTNESGVATWQNTPLVTSSGVCTVKSAVNSPIS